MAKTNFIDRYVNAPVDAVTADAADEGVVYAGAFDTKNCDSPSINIRVRSLAANKKVKFKLQSRNATTDSWEDVTNPRATSLQAGTNDEVEADGNTKYAYTGEHRYIRVGVISVGAAPEAVVDVWYQKHKLYSNPDNDAF